MASFWVAVVLIPLYVSQVLMLRSGAIPTLTDENFLRYRFGMDTVTVLLGAAFWGSFVTSAAAMALMMVVVRNKCRCFHINLLISRYHPTFS